MIQAAERKRPPEERRCIAILVYREEDDDVEALLRKLRAQGKQVFRYKVRDGDFPLPCLITDEGVFYGHTAIKAYCKL